MYIFRLRKPQDGLFMGTVDAYDTSNNTYRIRFDRETLGTLSVPDEDVVSAGELDTLPLSTFTVPKPRPQRPVEPDSPKMGSTSSSVQMMTSFSPQVQANDPLLSGRSPRGKVNKPYKNWLMQMLVATLVCKCLGLTEKL